MTPARSTLLAPLAALLILTAAPTLHAEDRIPGYVTEYRWWQAAEEVANERVTYEICGWGFIDLLTPFLMDVRRQGLDISMSDDLTKRYYAALRERRQMEAVLTAHGANAPMQRTTGLHATGGCADSVRERIERKASVPQGE